MKRHILAGILLGGLGLTEVAAQTDEEEQARLIGLEEVALGIPPMVAYAGEGGGTYYNGSDKAGGFTTGEVFFENSYNSEWMSWSGWAYSTTGDTETPGFGNQYSSYAGGAGEGDVYAVGFAPARLDLPVGWRAPERVLLTNTTYAALAMRDGDAFARKFGDDPATADEVESDYPDYLLLTITGYAVDGTELGHVEVYLADFRGGESEDFILREWLEVDLSGLSEPGEEGSRSVAELGFRMESTDTGDFGMNTPSYFALDGLVLKPTATWGPYDLGPDSLAGGGAWVDTGAFLGWAYPAGDYVFLEALEKWVYLPESEIETGRGAWIYIPAE